MALYVPPGVDADKIEANVKSGVLTGTLPKTAEETASHDQEGLICCGTLGARPAQVCIGPYDTCPGSIEPGHILLKSENGIARMAQLIRANAIRASPIGAGRLS